MSEPILTDAELAKLEADPGIGGEGYWTARLVAEVRRLREFPRGACPECRMLVSIEQERDHFDGIPTGVASRIVVRRGYDLEYEITGTITRRVLR